MSCENVIIIGIIVFVVVVMTDNVVNRGRGRTKNKK